MSSKRGGSHTPKPLKGNIIYDNFDFIIDSNDNNVSFDQITITNSTIINTIIGQQGPNIGFFTDLTTYGYVTFQNYNNTNNVSWNPNTSIFTVTGQFNVVGCSTIGNIGICQNTITAVSGNDINLSASNGNINFSANAINIPCNTPLTFCNTQNSIYGNSGGIYITGGLDVNSTKITNCTAPSLDLDVVNLWYLQNKFTTGNININGNFTQGQILVGGSGGSITSYPNFLYNTNGSIYIGGGLSLGNSILTGVPNPLNSSDAVNLGYFNYYLGINNGDIKEISVTLGNNVLSPLNVPFFVFNNSLVSSFEAFAYLQIPELNVYDQFQIKGVLEGSGSAGNWSINTAYIGNYQNNVNFSIINNGIEGQIQYINTNTSGTAVLRFRALTTSQGVYINITSGPIITPVNLGGTGTTFFTNGCLLFGNGFNHIETDLSLLFTNGSLFVGNGIDVNGSKITNCTAPSLDLDVVNLWYLQNKFTTGNGNFTQGQILVGGSGGSITSYPNFLYNTNGSIYIGGGLSLGNSILTGVPDPINPKDAVNLEYLDYYLGINNGDIKEISVTLGNNVLSPLNVPYFIFNNSLVSSFEAFAYLQIPELNVYDQFQIKGVLEGSGSAGNWSINTAFIGNYQNNVNFSIINNGIEGQIQYINTNTSGNAVLRFRALTTSQGIYTNITSGLTIIRPVNMGGTGTTFFTNGCLLFGNGFNHIETDSSLLFTNGSLNTNFLSTSNLTVGNLIVNTVNMTPSLGDLFYEQLFLANNNQIIPSNITGFLFNNNLVRYFEAIVSVSIIATNNLVGGYKINGIQTNSIGNWLLNTNFIGQNTGIQFSINTSGNIQYISSNISGFISNTIKFRALTLSI